MAEVTRALAANDSIAGAIQQGVGGGAIAALDAVKLVNDRLVKASSTPTGGVRDEVVGVAVSDCAGAGLPVLWVGSPASLNGIASGKTVGDAVWLHATAGKWDDVAPASGKSITLLGFWKSATDFSLNILNAGITKA